MLIPILRENIYIRYPELIIENSKSGWSASLKSLTYSNRNGVQRVNLKNNEIGYYYDPTLSEFLERYVLGCSIIGKKVSKFIDLVDVKNSIINERNMNIPFRFRLNCLENSTESESKLWKILHSREFRKMFRSIALEIRDTKHINISTQSILPVENTFFIADFVIKLSGRPPLIVELDGGYHDELEQQLYDFDRSVQILQNYGIEVLRVRNEELENLEELKRKISEKLLIIEGVKTKIDKLVDSSVLYSDEVLQYLDSLDTRRFKYLLLKKIRKTNKYKIELYSSGEVDVEQFKKLSISNLSYFNIEKKDLYITSEQLISLRSEKDYNIK